jgi:hypothetical protein
MKDQEIEARIEKLVEEERRLREQLASGEISAAEEHARLADAEASLDRMWDLLRQRRALREFDEQTVETVRTGDRATWGNDHRLGAAGARVVHLTPRTSWRETRPRLRSRSSRPATAPR